MKFPDLARRVKEVLPYMDRLNIIGRTDLVRNYRSLLWERYSKDELSDPTILANQDVPVDIQMAFDAVYQASKAFERFLAKNRLPLPPRISVGII